MRLFTGRPFRLAARARLALALLPLLSLACGRGQSPSPVLGQVFVKGRAADGAVVTFHPLASAEIKAYPTAVVGPDGSFRLTTTSAYDGAPPGDYAITVTWADSWREDGETRSGPDRLEGRYATPTASGLKATVRPGKNQLPRFDLN